ncbi:MAG: ThiF family adenylyltransferase [Agathobacter sp.]
MSEKVISLNADLKRLQDEGYELEVRVGCAIVHNIPYLDSHGTVQRGIFVSPLEMSGDQVKYRKNACKHIMYFHGTIPYRKNGEPLPGILLNQNKHSFGGIETDMEFSNKPDGDYNDYYEKFTRYIQILSAEAQAVNPTVTAATFKKVVSSDDSVFHYADTNASRAAISDITDKLNNYKVGIIGLGGTGSYLLDQVAKTPVSEIHLYDGDVFCQHNAFRAPGAPAKEFFEQQPYKADYFKSIYGNMHRYIFAHPYNLDEGNVSELGALDFVFIAMDSGNCKRVIVDYLQSHSISFIDTGIDITRVDTSLIGMTRATLAVNGNTQVANRHISFEEADKDLYASNIQTAELNAFCALTAVFKWKQALGFYLDNVHLNNCVYTTNDGEIEWA